MIPTSPLVSILVPVRNEAAFIARCLESIQQQDVPPEQVEILIVDGNSTDSTRQLVAEFAARDPRIRLLDNPHRIAPTALNIGIAAARGQVIVRVDGHCEIAPDYIRRCLAHLETPGVAGVGGPIATVGESFVARAIATGMSTPFGVGGSAFRTVSDRTLVTDTVAFPAYPRAILEEAGPFDEELVRNQDDEYNYRLRELGYKILLASDVRSTYYSRGTLRSLFRQYFQYGYWKVRVLQKHARQMQGRQFAPPLFVLSLLLLAAAAPFHWAFRVALAAEVSAYVAALLLGSVLVSTRKRQPRLLLVLPAVFAILHLAYGSGFLRGLIAFAGRWRDRHTYLRNEQGRPVIRLD